MNRLSATLLSLAVALSLVGGCSSTKETTVEEEIETTAVENHSTGTSTSKGTRSGQGQPAIAGAVSSVSVDEEQKTRPSNRIAEILKGRIAGVDVREGPGGIIVRIRGTSSIIGSNDPLYIVDGMPVKADPGGVLPGINPFDIERITVLKDVAATSTYGPNGANGVIVITMK